MIVAYADVTQSIPNGLSYDQAAPIFCAGYTVYSGLMLTDPKSHERIAVVGLGTLGHLGINNPKLLVLKQSLLHIQKIKKS
jgi:D-arabinose 1-dehydrogenase-like Zn-dependent alcohol dehydrogenase